MISKYKLDNFMDLAVNGVGAKDINVTMRESDVVEMAQELDKLRTLVANNWQVLPSGEKHCFYCGADRTCVDPHFLDCPVTIYKEYQKKEV